jgi:protein TonB
MKGLFVSLGIHAAGVAFLVTLPAFTRGAPPPAEPSHGPLMVPALVHVPTGESILAPPRGNHGGGGGIVAPHPNAPPAQPTIGEGPLLDPNTAGPLGLPPGPIGEETGTSLVASGPPQAIEPPTVVQVGGDIRPPRKVSGANPAYPPLAIAARLEGLVVLECTIAPDGRVVDLRVLRGHPLLDAAAVQAVSGWTYVPTLLNGRPVSVLMTVTVRFQLH